MAELHGCEDNKRRIRDRLSDLPDFLLHEILWRLETREVVRTSLLSKQWRDVWIRIPCLHFSQQTPTVISGVVAKWRGAKILKFSIAFANACASPSSDLDSWLHFAIEKQVEDLSLHLSNWRDINGGRRDEYCASPRLYSCSSIRKLFFSCCELKIKENVHWNQLKSLTIENTEFLSADAMDRILSGAPLLEELILHVSKFSENFSICSRSLKMLEIDGTRYSCYKGIIVREMLRIWAPSLLTLNISIFIHGSCLFDVPSLTSAYLGIHIFDIYSGDISSVEMFNQIFRSIRQVEKLTLAHWCIELLLYMKKKGVVVPFSNVKLLQLNACTEAKELLDILDMFPNLITVVVIESWDEGCFNCTDDGDHVVTVDGCYNSLASSTITFPNPFLLQLKSIEITWCMCDATIVAVARTLLENAHVLEKMVLRLKMFGASLEAFIMVKEKVLSMPRSSPAAQIIISNEIRIIRYISEVESE